MDELIISLVGNDVFNNLSADMKCIISMFLFSVLIMIFTSIIGYIRIK